MTRVLVVTNDFPPTVGGIQSYVRDFLATLDPADVVVFASTQDAVEARTWDTQAAYTVVRSRSSILLPTPGTARTMRRLIHEYRIDTVWFAAAAPLAMLALQARSAGARKVVASTHGHEVGWSMLPASRQALRFIGDHCDIITYISDYTLARLRHPFGPHPSFAHLPSGVSTSAFRRPDAEAVRKVRHVWGLDNGPIVSCVSRLVPRKGQDMLIKVWPRITQRYPDATLVLVGAGSYEGTLRRLASGTPGIVFTGRLNDADRAAVLAISDVFAMPARTRGKGLDVEGLGIVYLEAQAAGVPVIAGTSGGAPETLTPETGLVVDGTNADALEYALLGLLGDSVLRRRMGQAGVCHVSEQWTWDILGARLREILS